ncbi:PTS sugar transporter subunit IIB [Candidatus Merdisoma sp. JLR.KK006]|uniref:PTS sugar transporter subunit IIB n=1 Tax=Candidatus Merdisoma sp. JLR.KK006 TaxID=3112626 RepID=UPI001433CF3E|nr:PTS system cellobiose-specific EIIB component [Lachnospiraceae bacterium]
MKKIVLLCSAGMSTGMLVKKMEEAAAEMGYEADIHAWPVAEAERVTKDADIVLLGPQIRFQLNRMKGIASCPVEAIDMTAYGLMNGEKVMKRVKEVLGE